MSTRIYCDGCGTDLSKGLGPEVTGERRVGSGGGGLPLGRFDLCSDCAVVAFHAAVTRPPGRVDAHRLALAIQDTHRAARVTAAQVVPHTAPGCCREHDPDAAPRVFTSRSGYKFELPAGGITVEGSGPDGKLRRGSSPPPAST